MSDPIVEKCKERMTKALEALKAEFATVRTGKANVNVLANVKVSYWGVPTELSNCCSIKAQDAQTLLITPYDKSIVKDVQKAIQMADLNLNPVIDGDKIRIAFPALTQDTRNQLVKDVKKKADNCKVGIRSVRQDAMNDIKKIKKTMSEDLAKNLEDEVQKETDKTVELVDKLEKEKEKDLMTI